MNHIDRLILFFEAYEWDATSRSFKKVKADEKANTAKYKKANKKKAEPEPEFNWNPDTQSFKRAR